MAKFEEKIADWMPLRLVIWRKGTAFFSPAERGAYMDLILAYWELGPLPNDDAILQQLARVTDSKTWKQVRGKVLGKFNEIDGALTHARIDEERTVALQKFQRKSDAGRVAGQASAQARAKQPSTNGSTNRSTVGSTVGQPDVHTTYQEHSPVGEKLAEASLGKPRKASRISEHWQPNEKDQAYAADKGLNASTITNIAEQFRNHWLAKPKNNTSSNWSLNWCTWVQNHINYHGNGPWPSNAAGRSGGNRQSPRDVVGVVTRLKAGLEGALSVPEERGYSGGDRGGESPADDGSQEAAGVVIDATEFGPDASGGVRRFAG